MEQNQLWYRSNQVVAWFLMIPIVGQILLFAALMGSPEEHVTRRISLMTTLGLIMWLGSNARSAASWRKRRGQIRGVIERLESAGVSPV